MLIPMQGNFSLPVENTDLKILTDTDTGLEMTLTPILYIFDDTNTG